MNVVAIIPAYNEGIKIANIVPQVLEQVKTVIVIDDGSTDDTAERAEKAGAHVIRHPHNLGKGAACRSGFYAAVKLECDAIIMLDGDGQHDPEEIPLFLERAEELNFRCIVLGNRMEKTGEMPLLRLLTNKTLSFLISFLAGCKIKDSQCGFRYIHRDILTKVHYNHNRYDAESEILVRASRVGFKVSEVGIKTIYGNEYSKINVFWDTLRFIRFFFCHLFTLPPLKNSPEKRIAADIGEEFVHQLKNNPIQR